MLKAFEESDEEGAPSPSFAPRAAEPSAAAPDGNNAAAAAAAAEPLRGGSVQPGKPAAKKSAEPKFFSKMLRMFEEPEDAPSPAAAAPARSMSDAAAADGDKEAEEVPAPLSTQKAAAPAPTAAAAALADGEAKAGRPQGFLATVLKAFDEPPAIFIPPTLPAERPTTPAEPPGAMQPAVDAEPAAQPALLQQAQAAQGEWFAGLERGINAIASKFGRQESRPAPVTPPPAAGASAAGGNGFRPRMRLQYTASPATPAPAQPQQPSDGALQRDGGGAGDGGADAAGDLAGATGMSSPHFYSRYYMDPADVRAELEVTQTVRRAAVEAIAEADAKVAAAQAQAQVRQQLSCAINAMISCT